jgi:hypothetical protein
MGLVERGLMPPITTAISPAYPYFICTGSHYRFDAASSLSSRAGKGWPSVRDPNASCEHASFKCQEEMHTKGWDGDQ